MGTRQMDQWIRIYSVRGLGGQMGTVAGRIRWREAIEEDSIGGDMLNWGE